MQPTVLTGEAACTHCGFNLFEGESAFVKPDSDGSQLVYCSEECFQEDNQESLEKLPDEMLPDTQNDERASS